MNVDLFVANLFDTLKTTGRGSDMAAYGEVVECIGFFLSD